MPVIIYGSQAYKLDWVYVKSTEKSVALPPAPSKGFASALYQEPSGPWTPVSPSVYVTIALVTYTEGAWECPRQHYAQHNAIGQSPW